MLPNKGIYLSQCFSVVVLDNSSQNAEEHSKWFWFSNEKYLAYVTLPLSRAI